MVIEPKFQGPFSNIRPCLTIFTIWFYVLSSTPSAGSAVSIAKSNLQKYGNSELRIYIGN